jgi:molybdopterin-binding protein
MPRQKLLTASEAARALGVSLDTLRRWDRAGRIRTRRDSANRRLVPRSEIDRLRGGAAEEHELSARNRFRGVVRELKVEGLLAEVELEVTEPVRVVAVVTRESAERLGLVAGAEAAAVVKATSVMVER